MTGSIGVEVLGSIPFTPILAQLVELESLLSELKEKNAIQGIVPKRQQALLLLVGAKER
jgi:hypothetical protein